MHASLELYLQMQQWPTFYSCPHIRWSQQTTKTTFDVDLENKKVRRKIERDSNLP
jgi:hypothetical protein